MLTLSGMCAGMYQFATQLDGHVAPATRRGEEEKGERKEPEKETQFSAEHTEAGKKDEKAFKTKSQEYEQSSGAPTITPSRGDRFVHV
jgi:hypothetical protein